MMFGDYTPTVSDEEKGGVLVTQNENVPPVHHETRETAERV